MTVETDAWVPIPGYSNYEITSDGVVRIVMTSSHVHQRGMIIPLDTFVPDKSKPDEVSETYTLKHDEEGFRLISKQRLLDVIFKGIGSIEDPYV